MTPTLSDALKQLAVLVIGAAIIASLALAYAMGVRSQMVAALPVQEIEIPEAKDFGAAWDGIEVPPFRSPVSK